MKVLCFGEVLWDCFETENKIGGAPLNFAAHLVKNGVKSSIYTSVGQDELGEKAEKIIKDLYIDTDYLSVIDEQTAVCNVTLKDGIPSYNIKLGTAMDKIKYIEIKDDFNGFYFGSLSQRQEISSETLQEIFNNNTFKEVFFDMNIRQSYYNKKVLDFSLGKTTILKISREEIGVLKEVGICEKDDYESIARDLCEKYPCIKLVIITLDKDGAFVFESTVFKAYYSSKPKNKVVSTVGAGDSFSATFFADLLNGKSIENSLEHANKVSDYVVTQLGAIPDYPDYLKK